MKQKKKRKRTSQKPTFLPLLLTMRSVLAVALVDPAQEKKNGADARFSRIPVYVAAHRTSTTHSYFLELIPRASKARKSRDTVTACVSLSVVVMTTIIQVSSATDFQGRENEMTR